MTLVPEIHDQIRATAARRATGRLRGRSGRSRRPTAGPLTMAASTLVVAAVVAVTIVAVGAHDLANPAPTATGHGASPPPKGWAKRDAAATTQTQTGDRGCRPQLLTGSAPFRHDAPSQDLSSQLAVLRQPAPVSERVSAEMFRRAIKELPLNEFARGVYLRYVRHGEMNGIAYYVIPAANVNQLRAVPNRCYREHLAAFSERAAKLPAAERARLIHYEVAWLQTIRAAARHAAGVCLVHIGGGVLGRGPCVTAVSLHQLPATGSGGNNQSTVTAMIVPDPVATVTAHYSPQTYPGRVPRALTVTQRAINNVVIFNLRGAWDPPSSLIFRTASGSIIWSTARR